MLLSRGENVRFGVPCFVLYFSVCKAKVVVEWLIHTVSTLRAAHSTFLVNWVVLL